MRILIVVATRLELSSFMDELEYVKDKEDRLICYKYGEIDVDVLISGIGIIFTTYHLTRCLAKNKYHFVINAGISGSYDYNIPIGTVVNVVKEQFSELGIEEQEDFKTLFEVGFLNENEFPFRKGALENPTKPFLGNLLNVCGVTSDIAHGTEESIDKINSKFSPDVESMEGAAVFYVCHQESIPFLEIRAISNYVEKRDKSNWNIPLAIENLKDVLLSIIGRLTPVLAENS